MKKLHIAVLALVALAAAPTAADAAPSAAKQWNVNNANIVETGVEYELFNKTSRLGYENRTFGVNLGWTSKGGNFIFMRDPGRPNVRDHRRFTITGEEKLAIYNIKTRRYLKYYDRGDVKADLEWDRNPVYEWKVQDQSPRGNRADFALLNTRVNKYVIYKFRNYGINLGWLSQTAPQPQRFSVALTAQPQNAGWIPYTGSFGQNTLGNLLTVQNASQSATLLFVKPGKSSNDCSDPAATVPVAPRASMTADQLKTLYGTASPRLPVNFLACVTTPTPQSISTTFLNITYKLDS